jgi:outer membrane protein
MKQFPLFFLFFFVFVSSVKNLSAQQTTDVWTLEKCIDYAKQHNIELRRNALQFEAARQNLNIAYGNLLPTINFNYSNGFNYGRSIDPLTNAFTNQEINSNTYALNSNLPLFASFKNLHTIKKEKLALSLQDISNQQSVLLVIRKIFDYYLNILMYQDMLQVAENNYQLTLTDIKRTQRLVGSDLLSKKSILELNSQQLKDELAILEYKLKIDESKLLLSNVIGLEDYQGKLELDNPTIHLYDSTTTGFDARIEDITRTLEHNHQIKSAHLKQEMYLIDTKIARSSMLPKIDLTTTLYTGYSSGVKRFNSNTLTFDKYPYGQQLQDNYNTRFSFNIQIPILNGGYYRANYQKALIAYKSSALDTDEKTRTVKEELIHLYNTTYLEFKKLSATQADLSISKEIFLISEKEYAQHSISTFEYLLMKNKYVAAQIKCSQKKYDYFFSYKIFEMYMNNYFE